jgi:cyclase
MIEDPNYLTEPLIKTNGFQLTPNPAMQPYPCYPTVEVPREKGEVPHHLPGENPFLEEFAKKHHLPQAAVRGGAETALPEFMSGSGTRDSGPGSRSSGSTVPRTGEARTSNPGSRIPNPVADNEVHSLHVQGNVWMLHGGGVNAAIQIGEEGVLVVDTMTAGLADKLIAEIKKVAGDKPIRWIVNTAMDPDHTGGNAKVAEAGQSIIAGNFAGQAGQAAANFAKVLTHENVEARLVKVQPPLPVQAMPTDTFFTDEFEIHFNGEAIQFIHVPNAHTDGDVMVFFRKSDVLVAGDAFNTTSFPVIDMEDGGSLNGVVTTLNRILDITVPEDKQEGGTYVIPGHGRLTDEADVVEYRDMMTIIHDRVRNAVNKGMTLEQVKAARLVRDYEGRYGAARGAATADALVETAYRSLRTSSK